MQHRFYPLLLLVGCALALMGSSATAGGGASRITEIIVPSVMRQVNTYAARQRQTQSAANTAIELKTLTGTGEIANRLNRISAYIAALSDMVAVLRAAPVLAVYEARGSGMGAHDQTQAFVTMRDNLEAAGATAIVRKMQADRRYFAGWRGIFVMLRDNPDKWSPDDANNVPISFSSPGFEAAFWAHIDALLPAEKNTNAKADKAKRKTNGKD